MNIMVKVRVLSLLISYVQSHHLTYAIPHIHIQDLIFYNVTFSSRAY